MAANARQATEAPRPALSRLPPSRTICTRTSPIITMAASDAWCDKPICRIAAAPASSFLSVLSINIVARRFVSRSSAAKSSCPLHL